MNQALRDRIFEDICRERGRQEGLKLAGKFTFTLADPEDCGNKPAVLGEEFGEVCCAALNAAGSSTDGPERSDLRKELIQLAACAVAWVEALDCEHLSGKAVVSREQIEAAGLLVIFADDLWEVWCGADGTNIINAHLLASDAIRAVSIHKAQAELSALSARLGRMVSHGAS